MAKFINKEHKRFDSIFILYQGIADELHFWILIDVFFLSIVKGFTAQEIATLTSLSGIFTFIAFIPVTIFMKKIGNVYSLRLGSILFLTSSLLLTFGNSFFIILIGLAMYNIAPLFQRMSFALLKNNLHIQNRIEDYVKLKSGGNALYGLLSILEAMTFGVLFIFDNYLPMYICIVFCIIGLVLAFMLKEETDSKEKPNYKELIRKVKNERFFKPQVVKNMLIGTATFGMAIVFIANSKLLFNDSLDSLVDIDTLTYLFCAMIVLCRVGKFLGSYLVKKLWRPTVTNKTKIFVYPLITAIAGVIIVIGGKQSNPYVIFILISLGITIISGMQDPPNIISEYYMIQKVSKQHEQVTFSLSWFMVILFQSIASGIASMILLNYSLDIVLVIFSLLFIIMSVLAYIWRHSLTGH